MALKLNWTLALILVCTAVFILQVIGLVNENLFSFTPRYALAMPWTFVTSMFLHASPEHLFFNMLALFFFGLPLERILGSRRFLILYFASGIIGSIGYMITSGNPTIPAIGASGAIYGVMGTLALLMPGELVFIGGFFPMPMIMAVFFWTISEFLGLFAPGDIAHGAHLGGLFLGIVYGIYLRQRYMKTKPKTEIEGYADWER